VDPSTRRGKRWSRHYHECATCGHEWDKAPTEEVVVDVNGKPLAEGDDVVIIKDLKLDGKTGGIKVGTKIKSIRLVPGDHPIQGKVNGRTVLSYRRRRLACQTRT